MRMSVDLPAQSRELWQFPGPLGRARGRGRYNLLVLRSDRVDAFGIPDRYVWPSRRWRSVFCLHFDIKKSRKFFD